MIRDMINLDHAASTSLHPKLFNRLNEAFEFEGNAQSIQMAHLHKIISESKEKICRYFNGNPDRFFFTSGATESINTAIIGAAEFYHRSGNQIITFETEHSSTLAAVDHLKSKGFSVDIMSVYKNGHIDYQHLETQLSRDTLLITVNHICNETGIVQDLTPLFKLREKYGFMIHIDACQTIGKHHLSYQNYPADFISFSAHKCHGPQGIGGLYIAENRHVVPRLHGKQPVRSGTPSQALIYLMGLAVEIADQEYDTNVQKVERINHIFREGLRDTDHYILEAKRQVPHIVNVCFPSASLAQIDTIKQHIYCQNSASCFQGGRSHVLIARQILKNNIDRSLRFSFTHLLSEQDIRFACSKIYDILQK